MKRALPYVLIVGVLTFGAGVYFITQHASSSYLSDESSAKLCTGKGTSHIVTIEENHVNPAHTDAKQCDSLTIINNDDVMRTMAFGVHDHHTTYDGITQENLMKNQRLSVTLSRPGTFTFHDHLNDNVKGTFTVNEDHQH
jgi:hypothetical protein